MKWFNWFCTESRPDSSETAKHAEKSIQPDAVMGEAGTELTRKVSYEEGVSIVKASVDTPGVVVLSNGRQIQLKALQQYLFFGGWIEGFPGTDVIRQQLKNLMLEQEEIHHWKPFLIRPPEIPLFTEEQYNDPDLHLKGDETKLPPIVCIGNFGSGGTKHADDVLYESQLTIIWFQWDFAFPIESSVLLELKSIPWDEVANEFET